MATSVHKVLPMWNKEQNPYPAGAQPSVNPLPPPAVANRSLTGSAFVGSASGSSMIGETMRINGQISSREEMYLNGEVVGQIELDHRLIVGPQGKADATIKATEVVISGSVKGNVEATGRIVLRDGSNLVGDVRTAGIVIEDGAYFKGGIDITRPRS